jgi:hypothetical protein
LWSEPDCFGTMKRCIAVSDVIFFTTDIFGNTNTELIIKAGSMKELCDVIKKKNKNPNGQVYISKKYKLSNERIYFPLVRKSLKFQKHVKSVNGQINKKKQKIA